MTTPVSKDVSLVWEQAASVIEVGRGVMLLWENLVASDNEFQLNDGFLFDIDEAIKRKLDGIYVEDLTSNTAGKKRPLKAYFRWPTFEITDQSFPFATIELLRFERAADREQRGEHLYIPYTPKGFATPTDGQNFLYTEQAPIPYDFTHQITVHSRFNRNDRDLSFQLMQDDKFPTRGGYVIVGEGDAATVRQMFVNGPTNADGMDPTPGGKTKRHFRKVWTTRTTAEFFQKDIDNLSKVTSIAQTVEDLDDVVALTN